jgi:hypothetical protein
MIFAEKPASCESFCAHPIERSHVTPAAAQGNGRHSAHARHAYFLACFTNPLRNVAIVDAPIAELCILAATPLLSQG